MEFSMMMAQTREILAAGGPVFIILILLSVYSISVIAERYFHLRRAINYSRQLMSYARKQLPLGTYAKIEEACRKEVVKHTPAAILLGRLCKERNRSHADLEKIAQSTIDYEVSRLQKRLSILGTLGSITPFIGLFGTVIGVMHAFKDLAANTQVAGGATVVAAGIAEALVNTAAGLFVAIPAVIFYNYFLSKTTYFAQELDSLAQDFIYTKSSTDGF